ncbi:MAG: YiiG family protein [Alphaproteobacteria bacterium]|nr:YiiG family protein [Alphaproteobacteria bacterium]
MKQFFAAILAGSLGIAVAPQAWLAAASAQEHKQEEKGDPDDRDRRALFSRIDAYVTCLNALSSRIYESRARYFSWATKSGPTGREFIIYGLYNIDNPADCRESVDMVHDIEPHHPELEAVAAAYIGAVTRLYPVITEAERYYHQSTYKDDHMARGRALHPLLVAGFDEFSAADRKLRQLIDAANDARAQQNLTAIESTEGRSLRYHSVALLIHASELADTMRGPRDIARISAALARYEGSVTTLEGLLRGNDNDHTIALTLVAGSRPFLRAAKVFLRRVRDRIPYNIAERANLGFAGGIGEWMVEGSPANLAKNYNQLIDAYNRHTISPLLKWVPAGL